MAELYYHEQIRQIVKTVRRKFSSTIYIYIRSKTEVPKAYCSVNGALGLTAMYLIALILQVNFDVIRSPRKAYHHPTGRTTGKYVILPGNQTQTMG